MQLELQSLLKKEVDLVSEQSVSRHVRPFIEKKKKLILNGQKLLCYVIYLFMSIT